MQHMHFSPQSPADPLPPHSLLRSLLDTPRRHFAPLRTLSQGRQDLFLFCTTDLHLTLQQSVTDTLEIDATGDSSINDLAFSTQDLRLSPSISIWGSPTLSTNSNTAIFQPLNSAIANMRAPTVEAAHDGATTHGLPPAGHEERLGETNRDHIDTKHSRTQSGSQGAPSQQAQSAQVQNGQRQLPYHNRFRSFNPTRPASANFPEHVDSTQSQQVESNQAQRTARDFTNQHTVSNHAQHGPSGGAQQMPFQIHAPQPSSFRASQAFRELATPAPMVANTRAAPPMQQFSHQMQQGHGFSQQPMNMQHYPGPVQHSTAMLPLGNDFGHRALLSPVNVQGPFGLPHMAPMANIAAGPANFNPYAQHNGGSAVDPMMYGFSPIQMNGHNINGPQMSGAHVPGPPFTGPQMNGTQMYGAQTKGLYNNGPHNNGPHMNSPHNNVPHINSPYMNGTNFGGPQMNGGRLPGRDFFTQGDPFVENQQAMPGARPTGRDYNLRGNYSTGPSPVNSLVNGSSNGSSYGYQQNNGFANNHQQPLTEAARQAQLIKSGTLDQRNTVTPPRGRGLVSPGSDGTGSEYAVQSVVRSQVVMAPEIRPDPSWLTDGETPTLDQAYEHLPFVDDAANSSPSTAGVIKISNIPYTTTKNEVIAALGKSTRITSQPPRTPYYAIHIIMERSTGKTMDVYVELESAAEAKDAVDAFQQRCMVNRQPRIGDRHIDITLSSQEELMGELFPRAKCVRWEGSVPVVYETSEPYNSGFQGFLSGEELVMITKHAETPQRVSFSFFLQLDSFTDCFQTTVALCPTLRQPHLRNHDLPHAQVPLALDLEHHHRPAQRPLQDRHNPTPRPHQRCKPHFAPARADPLPAAGILDRHAIQPGLLGAAENLRPRHRPERGLRQHVGPDPLHARAHRHGQLVGV